MFLDIPGLAVPKNMRVELYTDAPLKKGIWGGEKPKHLNRLEQTLWPDHVKQAIVKIYKAHGLPDPMRQKLVEPIAFHFGGSEYEGAVDLSKVNWSRLIDYFAWEVEAVMDTGKTDALQAQAEKKYGLGFNHYQVYEDPSDY